MSDIWVEQGTQYISENARPSYGLRVRGATTVSAAQAYIYKNGTNVTATNFSDGTGTCSISGIIINLPAVTSLVGGNTYVISVVYTADGVQDERKIKLEVEKSSQE